MKYKTIKIEVDIFIEKDGNAWHAFCPVFKGLHAEGTTINETIKNAHTTIIEYIKSYIRHNDPIPTAKVIEKNIYQNMKHKTETVKIPISTNSIANMPAFV